MISNCVTYFELWQNSKCDRCFRVSRLFQNATVYRVKKYTFPLKSSANCFLSLNVSCVFCENMTLRGKRF